MAGTAYSFHIAVERYQDPSITTVKYAEAEARDLAEALELHHHFDKRNQQLLLSAQATKAATESKVRDAIRKLAEEDTFVLSYAGHGFSRVGENFITCYDTQPSDPIATSISLQDIYNHLRASSCKRVVCFWIRAKGAF
jgi:uncharacterized caspase-like protein